MVRLRSVVSAFVVVGLGGTASAQDVGETILANGFSVLGATLEGSYQIEPDARVRGVLIGGLSYDQTEEDDDGNSYEIDASLTAAAVLVDFFPTGPGWRLSGGVLFNASDLEALGTGGPSEPFEINGQTFVGGVVEADVRFNNQIAPMITTGYDYPINENWILSGEIGAIFTGGFDIDVTANSDALQTEIDNDPDYQELRSDADDLTILPYISVSVGYRF